MSTIQMLKNSKAMPYMAYEEQQQITTLCVRCALILMQYGAESAMVVDLTKRLGLALGVDSVECAVSFNSIALSTIYNNRSITTTRDTITQGINVNMLVQIQKIITSTENQSRSKYLLSSIKQSFDDLDSESYPSWMVVFFVGGSCACFAYLNSSNLPITILTFIAGALAMATRIFLSKQYFNTFVTVIITAFIAALIGATTYFIEDNFYLKDLVSDLDIRKNADIAVASSVLLLVPSFPVINALSDILQGYLNMGIGRFIFASMLTLSACVGIVLVLTLLGIKWGGI